MGGLIAERRLQAQTTLGFAVDAARFTRCVRAQLATVPDDRAHETLASLHLADLFLASACVEGAPEAIAFFERTVMPSLKRVLTRRLSAADADEASQRLRVRFMVGEDGSAPSLLSYQGRAPLAAWARAAAAHLATDLQRATDRRRDDRDDLLEAVLASGEAQDTGLVRRELSDLLRTSLGDALAALEPGQRTLLALHFRERLTYEQIGRLHGVNRSTICRRIQSCVEHVREAVRRGVQRSLRLDPRQLESLLHATRSGLDVSLTSVWSRG